MRRLASPETTQAHTGTGHDQRQPELDKALMQAQRFISSGEWLSAAQLLARYSRKASQAGAAAIVETVRLLCLSGGDHVRLANELQAAAHQHQTAAQRIRQRIHRLVSIHLSGSDDGSDQLVDSTQAIDPPADITVAVLGRLEITVLGEPITRWASQKSRTLFQYLVLHSDRPVRREVLIELLWPGHSEVSARNNLNACLYTLRRTLGSARPIGRHVLYREGCYYLNPQLIWRIDRDEFVSLTRAAQSEYQAGRKQRAIELYREAVELYRGPLLDDDSNTGWFDSEQRSLEELHAQALEDLTVLHLGNRNPEAARETAQRILRQDPCRESAHRLLMRCYALQNQRSLIARQFQLCTTALAKELGVAPTDETARLFRELVENSTV